MGKAPFLARRRAKSLVDEAHALDERGDPSGAWATLERALKVDPECFEAEFLLGRIANDRGRHAIAVEHLQRATRLSGTDAFAFSELGRAYHELKRRGEAEAAYTRSLDLRNDPYTAINLATLLRDSGRFAEASALYQRALDAGALDGETAARIRAML